MQRVVKETVFFIPQATPTPVITGRQRITPIKDTDIFHAEKAALKDITTVAIFFIHPPGNSRRQQILSITRPPTSGFRHQITVRRGGPWIFIQHFQVDMCRRSIKIIIMFLDILVVIALWHGQTEQTFFLNRVDMIPQGEGKTDINLRAPCPRSARSHRGPIFFQLVFRTRCSCSRCCRVVFFMPRLLPSAFFTLCHATVARP
jgi:hypothetical protein